MKHWDKLASRLLKRELRREEVTYEELARRLTAMGAPETLASISSKMQRASFRAGFFLAAMKAVGRKNVDIEELK